MEQDDTFTSIAKADFTIRLIAGFVIGIIGFVGSLVGLFVSLAYNKTEIIGFCVVAMLCCILVSGINGYILFRKGKKKEQNK